jgi:N-acetylmuramoyl-L-alanine amidase
MKHKIVAAFLLVGSLVFAQRTYKITAQIDGGQKEISFIVKNGIDYISCTDFAKISGAEVFFNSEISKLEIKFNNYSLKFTAHNQFIVITRKTDDNQVVFQLPVSALLIRDDIFVPLIYTQDYLMMTMEKTIEYDGKSKNLSIINKPVKLFSSFSEDKIVKEENDVSYPANRYDIYDINIEEKANGTLIRLKTNRPVKVPRNSINEGVLFVFFSDVNVIPNLDEKIKPVGLIKEIKQKYISPKNIQLEFHLNEGFSNAEVLRDQETNDLLISIHNKIFINPATTSDLKAKWNFDCVVIDAGHGGKDPGTIGVKGTKEKDINVAIALKLGRLIENNIEGVRVVYTRRTDEFIELYRRGKIANEAGGKLFISIHGNSTESKDNGVRGFEVYLLRPGRTKEAIRIAEVENSVIKYEENPNKYDKLTDENFILVSMAHSQYMRYSESFSDLLNQEWRRRTEIPSLGIKQAGFYVLVGASMPGVLIETGFLSNRRDEVYLNSIEGQTNIAESIFNSIKKYKEHYEKEIKN